MELLLSRDSKDIISVFINVSGKVIYSDADSFLSYMNINKDYIFDIVDKNKILKLSMHDSGTEHLLTSLEGYKNCIATVMGMGIGKHIWLCFIADKIYNNALNQGKDINKMIKIYANKNNKLKSVDMDLFVAKVVKTMAKEGINIKKGECVSTSCPINLDVIKIMMIASSSILRSVSPKEDITVDADITDYGARINMWTKAEGLKNVKGVVDFCENYPFSSANIIYLNTLANKDGIELILSLENKICKVSFTYPLGDVCEFDVLASDMYEEEEAIKGIIDIFFT